MLIFKYQKVILWYQKLISDIRKSISEIRKAFSDIRKCGILYSHLIFWYQKLSHLLISENGFSGIGNSWIFSDIRNSYDFLISENDFLLSENYFLLSKTDFLISENHREFLISKNIFWFQTFISYISNSFSYACTRKLLDFLCRNSCNFLISKIDFLITKLFSDIVICCLISKIFWYPKIFCDIRNFWYQKIIFCCSKVGITVLFSVP